MSPEPETDPDAKRPLGATGEACYNPRMTSNESPPLADDNRAIVYIDGLNFYYGALKSEAHPERKWLHLEKWAAKILPDRWRLSGVRYFTSQVTDEDGRGALERQAAYFAALRAMGFRDVFEHPLVAPDLRLAAAPVSAAALSGLARTGMLAIHHGHRNKKRTIYGRLRGESEKRRFRVSPQEKGTDVNLAARMMADAANNRFDLAVLVANDGDYAGLCRAVLEDFDAPERFGPRKKILLFPPALGGRKRVEQLAASVGGMRNVRPILPAALDKCQLPEVIPGTDVCRPKEWRKKSA